VRLMIGVANERCGRWYIPPERIAESVYFKSTDGHTGQWGFSLRRLNLHIIDLVARSGGSAIFVLKATLTTYLFV
jgi:tRNA A64-2'-O-ribosylphosphate transferase